MAKPRSSAKAVQDVEGAHLLIVEARYYDGIADDLLAGAKAAIEAADAVEEPFDGVVALGCVIRGETGHYDIVAGESARALMDISTSMGLPLGNGILTVENEAQAWARARVNEMNKGGGAAEAALSLIALKRRFSAGE